MYPVINSVATIIHTDPKQSSMLETLFDDILEQLILDMSGEMKLNMRSTYSIILVNVIEAMGLCTCR